MGPKVRMFGNTFSAEMLVHGPLRVFWASGRISDLERGSLGFYLLVLPGGCGAMFVEKTRYCTIMYPAWASTCCVKSSVVECSLINVTAARD